MPATFFIDSTISVDETHVTLLWKLHTDTFSRSDTATGRRCGDRATAIPHALVSEGYYKNWGLMFLVMYHTTSSSPRHSQYLLSSFFQAVQVSTLFPIIFYMSCNLHYFAGLLICCGREVRAGVRPWSECSPNHLAMNKMLLKCSFRPLAVFKLKNMVLCRVMTREQSA